MSQVIKISLDDMGRILIPAAVQSRLGLSPGMSLVVEEGYTLPRQPARAVAEPPDLHRSGQYYARAVQGVGSDHWRLAFWVRESRHVRQGEVVSTAACAGGSFHPREETQER
jgi:bifunctional DNA-binding transcriptional regulator/antitoxin component of YhaV-PrlF toxin-antitoxin module